MLVCPFLATICMLELSELYSDLSLQGVQQVMKLYAHLMVE